MDDDKNLLLMESGYPHLPQTNKMIQSQIDTIKENQKILTGAIYDEEEFSKMTEKGAAAWADVEDADEWLENLRSGK